MNAKVLAKIQTYDHDATSRGHDVTLYADGHLSAQTRSCWAKSRTDTRYITNPGYVDTSEIDPNNPDCDAEAILTTAWDNVMNAGGPDVLPGWRRVRRGHLVQ